MNLITAENLSRYYGKHCAVRDLSFSLQTGQILGFLGENGAGKTTTLQMLSGNLAPSSGTIRINGFDLSKQAKAAKHHLGYVPDTPPLYKELTVLEFLNYCAKLHGVTDTKAALALTMQRCGLIDVQQRLIGNLSKGYQQRIGIAQALLHNPEVIILDEPTVGLDPIQIREIRALIKELGQTHGVIFSTHILSEVQETCTDVLIIRHGETVLNSPIAELNQQMKSAVLLITTKQTVNIEPLLNIAGVLHIEQLSAQQLKVQHSLNDNPTPALMTALLEQGCELQELTPVKQSLEDVFISLTQES